MHSISEQGYIQQVSIDCVIFGYHRDKLSVLIPKLNFKGEFWALPTGFVYQREDIDEAASRIIRDRTGIDKSHLESFQVSGRASRNSQSFLDRLLVLNPEMLDTRQRKMQEYDWFTQRFISIGYYALVDMNKVIPQKHDIDAFIDWYDVHALPPLIMDHCEIVTNALKNLLASTQLNLNALHLLPEIFTMKEAQELYEALLDKPLARNNFQKKILEMNGLERLEKKFTGAANKAPYVYRLLRERLTETW